MRWACGVTSVPSRQDVLARTLKSIEAAGFDKPRLFVDGAKDNCNTWLGYEASCRYPVVHAFGNFWLGLLELWVRDPLADLFAMFQDDILLCKNVRQYAEASLPKMEIPYYLSLFTCKPNEERIRGLGVGWHPSNQHGWGAQALVFPRDTVLGIFQSRHWVERPLGMRMGKPNPEKAWKNLDGGVCSAVQSFGGKEVVHNPSLVLHVDCSSAIGNTKDRRMEQGTWPGENFDALELLNRVIA